MKWRSLLVALPGVVFVATAGESRSLGLSQTVPLRQVALGGMPTPDLNAGTSFTRVSGDVVINAAGQVMYRAEIAGLPNTSGDLLATFIDTAGSREIVLRENDAVPGAGPGVTYLSPSPFLNINASGAVAIENAVAGVGGVGNESAIVAGQPGALQLIALNGEQAPSLPVATEFRTLVQPLLNDAGRVAFDASTDGRNGNPDVNGIWSDVSGNLELIAFVGQQAPGTPPQTQFDSVSLGGLTSSGKILVRGRLTGPNVGFRANGLWVYDNGTLAREVGTGDPIPNSSSGGVFKSFTAQSTAINDAGDIAFSVVIEESGQDFGSVWTKKSGALQEIARTGDQAPGLDAGVLFSGVSDPLMNQAGDIAFNASIVGTGIPTGNIEQSLWFADNAVPRLVVREGDPVPEMPGLTFDRFGTPMINGARQVAFVADLINDSGPDLLSVWVADPDGELHLAVYTGQEIDVNDDPAIEDFRTVRQINVQENSSDTNGTRNGFNAKGELAFSVGFTDGSAGVFVATIPEPGTGVLFTAAAGLIARRRRVGR